MKGLDGQESPGEDSTLSNRANQQSPNTNRGERKWHTRMQTTRTPATNFKENGKVFTKKTSRWMASVHHLKDSDLLIALEKKNGKKNCCLQATGQEP